MDEREARRALARFGIDPTLLEAPPLARRRDRAVWRAGEFALKKVAGEHRAEKILRSGVYLKSRGVPVAAPAPPHIVHEGDGCYLLFPWVDGRTPGYTEPGMIEAMAALLSRFHRASEGYIGAGGPVEQSQADWTVLWIDTARRLRKASWEAAWRQDPFGRLLLGHVPWLKARIDWCLERLPGTGYARLLAESRANPLLGHGDFGCQNLVLTGGGDLVVIDLDQVAISLPVRDLARLVTWVNHDLQNWSGDRFERIVKAYGTLSAAERDVLLLDQVMPHLVTDLARDYYFGSRKPQLEELEHCLATDREKLKDLGLGPLP